MATPTPRRLLPVVGAVALVLLIVLTWWGSGGTPGPQEAGPAAAGTTTSSTSTTDESSSRAPASTTDAVDPESGLPWIEAGRLPAEAARTLRLIDRGGPYPYDRDGTTFRNAERLLPREASGYYREYTVPTPGEDDRGARRIVTGRGGEFYWTADHYASFQRIRR